MDYKEQMPFWMMLLLSKMSSTKFWEFYEGDRVCGLAYLAAVENLVFLMFLAVDPACRSRGYGGRILEEIAVRFPQSKLVVSIERCAEGAENLEQRKRRKRFYRQNGYAETGFLVELSDVEQEILIKNGAFSPEEFAAFFKAYSNGTMKPRIWKAEETE